MRFPTRNANAAINEWAMRNAPPVPPNHFAEPAPPGQLMGQAFIAAKMERERMERQAQQRATGSATLGAGAVSALTVLADGVEAQRDGRELDLPAIHAALAQLARILDTAHQRGLGIPVGVTYENTEVST